jgi:hypothetical protein
LWPDPHSIRCNFEASASGAEWIDAAASLARTRLHVDSATNVIGHFDWRVENLGFTDAAVAAIYDWDSVFAAPEALIVGSNAAQFCTDWDSDVDDPLPSVAAMVAFVKDYERARGATFTSRERQQLDAANLATITYGARCQHSDYVSRPEPGSAASGRWFRLLRERGDHLFDA